MPKRLRIALLIESSREYGRGLLRGIANYAKVHGPWALYHHERRMGDDSPPWLNKWSGDGIIARIESRRLLHTLEDMDLPCVDLRCMHETPKIPMIATDDRAVVQLGIEHLLSRGFTNLAFCGFDGADYSMCRSEHFVRMLHEHGIRASVYQGKHRSRTSDTSMIEAEGLLYEDEVARWLHSLPKPVGVMACNDVRGVQILSACRDHGINVPEQVAVIGVDNDDLLCDLSDPPLSSVEPNTIRIGFEAAGMLHAMVRGDTVPPRIFVPPKGVFSRSSSDVLAIDDPHVARALRFIRDHATESISVSDVLAHVQISRSTLERRFSQLLHRSPKDEIIRLRIEAVKRLLQNTTYTLPQIAEATGFKHHEYMSSQFKQRVGTTPGQFRRESYGPKE